MGGGGGCMCVCGVCWVCGVYSVSRVLCVACVARVRARMRARVRASVMPLLTASKDLGFLVVTFLGIKYLKSKHIFHE